MKLSQIIGLALLAAGMVALYFGWQSTDSPAERLSEAVTGRYSDETMIYLVAGGVGVIVGLGLTVLGRRK